MQEGGYGEARMREETSASVPDEDQAKQAEEAKRIATWAAPAVWTKRMLTALVNGVKGGNWFSLIDKVYSAQNLLAAFYKVKANGGAAGVDHQTIGRYEKRLEANLERLQRALKEGSYRPQAVRRTWIPKAGTPEKRPLGIPTVQDRIVQTAVRNVLEPIFDREFAEHSYGFRPGRGCKDALRKVEKLLREGYRYVVDADLKSYFDTIDHDKLMQLVEQKVTDSRVLKLLRLFLSQEIMEDLTTWTPEKGSPQGAVVSPLLSNIFLNPLDHMMAERGYEMVRYADDFILLCRSEEKARRALEEVKQWTAKVGLTLHPTKTRIVDTSTGSFEFLGYEFTPKYKWPRKKSLQKLKDTIRRKTRRTNGHSLSFIIKEINRTLVGWFEYFKHSYRTTFPSIDGWVRMRLRSILRKRSKKRGRGRGGDHIRWTNAFFAKHGLFSLQAAHAKALSVLSEGNH